MRVQLHNTGKIGMMKLRHALDVTYPLRHDCKKSFMIPFTHVQTLTIFDNYHPITPQLPGLSRLKRVFMNSIVANLTTPKGFGNNHTPAEINRRLLFASHYKQVSFQEQ